MRNRLQDDPVLIFNEKRRMKRARKWDEGMGETEKEERGLAGKGQ